MAFCRYRTLADGTTLIADVDPPGIDPGIFNHPGWKLVPLPDYAGHRSAKDRVGARSRGDGPNPRPRGRGPKPIKLVRFDERAWDELKSHDLGDSFTEVAGPIYGFRPAGGRDGFSGDTLIVCAMPRATRPGALARHCEVDAELIDHMTSNMRQRGLALLGTWHSHPGYAGERARYSKADLAHWRSWQPQPRPWGTGGGPFLGLIITPGAGDSWSHPKPTAHIIRDDGGKLDYAVCEFPGFVGPLRTSVPKPWEL
jgi:hypothetical protein